MVLLINACVRKDSRTKRLADFLLNQLDQKVNEINLSQINFPKADEDFILHRTDLIEEGLYSDPLFDLAKEFAAAEIIVIAAPFWDLSFPAIVKQYFEQICIQGITFHYDENGVPKGLCKAKKLYYVTTSGGFIHSDLFGYGYVKTLAQTFFGIDDCVSITAEGLDIDGADVEEIIKEAMERVKNYI